MDMQMINLTIGLLIFMMANVMLGSVNSLFDGTFNKKKLFTGIGKALIVIAIYCAVFYAGSLNANIVVMEVDGVEANVITALYITMLGSYIGYGKQLIQKFKLLLTPNQNKESK